MTIIKILGVDPSLTNTAYVVTEVDCATRQIVNVLEMGTFVTEPEKSKAVRKSSSDLARARAIALGLARVIKSHGIKVAASEVPAGAQSANASRAFGIVVGLLASLPVPIIEVSPREVKLASVGTSTADKEDIVRWAVEKTRGMPVEWPSSKRANDWSIAVPGGFVTKTAEHQADALAAVQAAIASEQFRQLAAMLLSLAA